MFLIDGAVAMIVTTLVGGAYLSGFLDYIGFPYALIGIFSAFPLLCSFVQVAGAFAAARLRDGKLLVIACAGIFRMGFALMYMLSFAFKSGWGMAAAAALFFVSCSVSAFLSPAASEWLVSLVPHRFRGKYMGLRESVALLSTAVAALVIGWVLDAFKASGNTGGGFIALGAFIALCCALDVVALLRAKAPPFEKAPQAHPGRVLLQPFRHKAFRPVLILCAVYQIAAQLGIAYWGLYLVSDLKISYSLISLVVFVTSIEKGVFAHFWGRVADRTSWQFVTTLMVSIIGASHLLCAFLVAGNVAWLYPMCSVISSVGWSGMGICLLNIQFEYAPEENRLMFLGVNNALNGLLGFAGAAAAGIVMARVTSSGVRLFGAPVKAQQLLIFVSGVSLLLCGLYIRLVLGRKRRRSAAPSEPDGES